MGTILGLALSKISRLMIKKKCIQHSLDIPERLLSVNQFLSISVAAMNGIGWLIFSCIARDVVTAVELSVLFTIAVVVISVDNSIRIIPNEIVLILLGIGFVINLIHFTIFNGLIGMVTGLVLFIIAGLIGGFNKVGMGDIKLIIPIGLIAGYPNSLFAILVMSLLILVYSAVGMMSKKITLKTTLPFGGFMMSGLIVTLLLNQ